MQETETKFATSTARDKKDLVPPVVQWDQLAYRLVQQDLAPDGFKKIEGGTWRGSIIAKTKYPGLLKSQVNSCQVVSAQLIRTYRGKAQREVQEQLKKSMKLQDEAKVHYKATPFWRFKKKKRWYRLACAHAGYVEAYQECMGILLQLDVK